jgi:hypothetical protein
MHSRPASWRFLWTALGVTSVVFLAVYWESFHVLPASDDFSYVNEIHRGNREGVWRFFTRSVTAQTYRPMTSVGIWAFGNLVPSHPTEGIRALHLLSAIAYAAVALLWIRAARLARAGTAAVIATMLLHPVLPQAVGSIDGFNSLVSSAFLWLGAWYVFKWRDRPIRALLAASLSFALGVLFKEYAFALVPLSMLTVLCFWRAAPLRWAMLFALALGMLLLLVIFVRKYTIPPDPLAQGGWNYLASSPVELAKNVVKNAALLAGGLLFFGNSVWAFVNQSTAVLATVGLSVLAVVALVAWGVFLRLRHSTSVDGESLPRWLAYLLLSFAAASFPAILVSRVSEMYVPPLVLPLAVLFGFAADGLRPASFPARAIATTAAAVMLVSSVLAIRAKVAGLVDVGRRADRQLQQILALLPPDARDKRICIRFLAADRRPRDLYAVFRMPDHLLVPHAVALNWPRPYRNLVLDSDTVRSFEEVDPRAYDLALGWDARRQMFFRLEPGRAEDGTGGTRE